MRSAFTLFEVGISALLIALSLLTLAMFLPVGIKAQQKARFEIYAATKSLDLVDFVYGQGFNINTPPPAVALHMESDQPWDSVAGYRAYSPDLESMAVDVRGAAYPVPPSIAERLTSPGDEIRRILELGGNLYYASALASEGYRPDVNAAVKPPSESQKLVFTVSGYAQQNAVPYLSYKCWPYYAPYPSPPMVRDNNSKWELGDDPDIAYIYEHNFRLPQNAAPQTPDYDGAGTSGYYPYFGKFGGGSGNLRAMIQGSQVNGGNIPWLASKHYVALALWYAYRKNIPLPFILGTATEADIDAAWDNPALVRAMRYLAHAGMTMTKWFPLDGQPGLPATNIPSFRYSGSSANINLSPVPTLPGLRLGVPIPGNELVYENTALNTRTDSTGPAAAPPSPTLQTIPRPASFNALLFPSPTPTAGFLPPATISTISAGPLAGHFYVTETMIANWANTSLKLGMRFAAEKPYDWRVLRPMNRSIMMDDPLIQYDLMDSNLYPIMTGTIAGTAADPNLPGGGISARMWRPVAARDTVQAGRNARGASVNWDAIKGDIRHFSLTAPFHPSERCRQIVFWAVDWQSYEDVETAVSAPVDASRYPRRSPGYSALTTPPTPEYLTTTYMGGIQFLDLIQPRTRNPEKFMLFVESMASVPTGGDARWFAMGADLGSEETWGTKAFSYVGKLDRGWSALSASINTRSAFTGQFGADRNWNQKLDRGPLPTSTTLRALPVGRFNYYDPRLALGVR